MKSLQLDLNAEQIQKLEPNKQVIESSGDLTDPASGSIDAPLPHGTKAVLLTIKLVVTMNNHNRERQEAYIESGSEKRGRVQIT